MDVIELWNHPVTQAFDDIELLIGSELNLLQRKAMKAPLPSEKRRVEKGIVDSSYSPLRAFEQGLAADLEHFWIPLIQSMIDRSSELRLEYLHPYGSPDVVYNQYFEQRTREAWESAVLHGHRIASDHVIASMGRILDYKHEELSKHRDQYLKTNPAELVQMIKDRLAKAIGETNLKITKMKTEPPKSPGNSAHEHPAWRLAALVIVLGLALLGFWLLPLQGAIACFLLMIFLLPLIMAGITHERMPAKDFSKMYIDGLKQLPLLGPLLGSVFNLGKRSHSGKRQDGK